MRLFFLALLISLFVACVPAKSPGVFAGYTNHSSPPAKVVTAVLPVYIDKDFTFAEKEEIHMAFYEWNKALNGYARFNIVSNDFSGKYESPELDAMNVTGQGIIVYRMTSDNPVIQAADDSGRMLAFVPDLGSHEVFVVADRIGTRKLSLIMMHELGHDLGLTHDDIEYTLMFPYAERQPPCIDKITMLRIATRFDFDINHLNYCELD